MGMPISNFQVLKLLMDGNEAERAEVDKAISHYRLFAFILHDPARHGSFHRKLEEIFERLDYLTGPHLMFFTLADAPPSWKSRAADRQYYTAINHWMASALRDPGNVPKSFDAGLTSFALSYSLNISLESPCILLTENLRSIRFFTLETSESRVEEQLRELGMMAHMLQPGEPVTLEKINYATGKITVTSGQSVLGQELSRVLSDVLSYVIAGNSRDLFDKKIARRHALSSLKNLSRRLNECKRNDDSETGDLEALSVQIMLALSMMNEIDESPRMPMLDLEENLLEYESVQILRTAARVNAMLMNDVEPGVAGYMYPLNDFSPGVICLSKVFERETNLSVVHWIRRKLGVKLPEYFDRYQPGLIAKLDNEVDFNKPDRYDNTRWLPPGTGQSEIVFDKLTRRETPAGLDFDSMKILKSSWIKIRDLRNAAAHDRITKLPALQEMQTVLDTLVKNRCFHRMSDIKQKNRSD